MADAETFTQLPLQFDAESKTISSPTPSKSLQTELSELNALYKSISALDAPNAIPPPPVPVNPKLSASIAKLRESANTAYRASNFTEAYRLYTLGLSMALKRPLWEPSGLVRDEVAGLYANRAQTNMALRNWVEGLTDAKCSVEAKKGGNAKAWWRGGRCLCEMGRWEEAREWVGRGLEVEGGEADLVRLGGEIDARLAKKALA